jgi:3-dehydroquinate dehydratase-2
MPAPRHVLVLHGPNLNLLGTREPELYGRVTLSEIERWLTERAANRGATVESFQSNSESALIDRLQDARGRAHGVLINAAAYTHTSLGIFDALRSVALPAVEVHLTHVAKREDFRQRSAIAPACIGVVAGFGARSYTLALDGLLDALEGHSRP